MAALQGVGKEGTVFHCNMDGQDHIVKNGKVADVSPQDIQDAKSNGNYLQEMTNWRDFDDRSASSSSSSSRSSKVSEPNGGPVPGDVSSWIDEASKVLAQQGITMSAQDKSDMARIAMHESSGDPRAVNHTDGNAAAGHPSMGLVQTIQPTFDSYKLPGHDDIMNPVDNIIAGYRYANATYGSVANTPGIKSLNSGGDYLYY